MHWRKKGRFCLEKSCKQSCNRPFYQEMSLYASFLKWKVSAVVIFLITFWVNAMESNIFLIITLTGFQIEHGWLICVWFYCFICFIGNSIDTEGFQEYVSSKLGEREKRILEKQHFTIDIKSDIADVLSRSQMVSGLFQINFIYL